MPTEPDDFNNLNSYDYSLPRELIAQQPVEQRIDARLWLSIAATGSLAHHHVRDLPEFLEAGDALVLNTTKVIPARLVGTRTSSGGRWEGLFLHSSPRRFLGNAQPIPADIFPLARH